MNKLVIFDCDGVLIDSEVIANRIHAEALTAYGYPMTAEESSKKFTGLTPQAVCEIIVQESGLDLSLDYWARLEPVIFQAYNTELRGLMQPILERLHAMQIKRCVASNSDRAYVIRCLELTEQFVYFNQRSIFNAEQVKKGKPAPDLFLLAAQQMGCDPKECMVVEDSQAGIEAALAAGMQVIAFLGGGHAQYGFYEEKIRAYGVPIVKDSQGLLSLINSFILQDSPVKSFQESVEARVTSL